MPEFKFTAAWKKAFGRLRRQAGNTNGGLPAKRDQQLNLKVSAACKARFDRLVRLEGKSNSEIFEEMVAERLRHQGRR